MNRFVQCGLHRRLMAMLLWCLPLAAVAAPAVVPTPVLPVVGVHIAPVDVVANVRRMLEQAYQQQQRSPANPPAAGSNPSTPSAATEGQPAPPPSATPPASHSAAAPPVTAVKPAAPASGTPVELPNKVITIRDLKDLRGLADELEKARRRQQRREGAQP